ncbi:hypothetical protein LTR53_000493 [Teratosphaeriaceae sp. CCFEE 6253]|nr:hypothetical protein LTR53_000493 [Teratosphaeriaceae sp. CCFEE 6253]
MGAFGTGQLAGFQFPTSGFQGIPGPGFPTYGYPQHTGYQGRLGHPPSGVYNPMANHLAFMASIKSGQPSKSNEPRVRQPTTDRASSKCDDAQLYGPTPASEPAPADRDRIKQLRDELVVEKRRTAEEMQKAAAAHAKIAILRKERDEASRARSRAGKRKQHESESSDAVDTDGGDARDRMESEESDVSVSDDSDDEPGKKRTKHTPTREEDRESRYGSGGVLRTAYGDQLSSRGEFANKGRARGSREDSFSRRDQCRTDRPWHTRTAYKRCSRQDEPG